MQARRLLKPEELMALHPRTAITFAPGVPPIRTWLLRYYEEKSLFHERPSSGGKETVKRLIAASIRFCVQLVMLAGLLAAAACLTQALMRLPHH